MHAEQEGDPESERSSISSIESKLYIYKKTSLAEIPEVVVKEDDDLDEDEYEDVEDDGPSNE